MLEAFLEQHCVRVVWELVAINEPFHRVFEPSCESLVMQILLHNIKDLQ